MRRRFGTSTSAAPSEPEKARPSLREELLCLRAGQALDGLDGVREQFGLVDAGVVFEQVLGNAEPRTSQEADGVAARAGRQWRYADLEPLDPALDRRDVVDQVPGAVKVYGGRTGLPLLLGPLPVFALAGGRGANPSFTGATYCARREAICGVLSFKVPLGVR